MRLRRSVCFALILGLPVAPVLSQDMGFKLRGCAYGPFRDGQSPQGLHPSVAEIREDLRYVRNVTRAIRTYSVEQTLAAIPKLARTARLACHVGAWIGTDRPRNEAELETLLEVSRKAKPEASIVGNEALLRGDVSVAELLTYVDRVRRRTRARTAVGVAEPWHVWLAQPALADAVDVLYVHVHPYWEGIAVELAAAYVLQRFVELQQAYPTKKIVIGETGWPSAGATVGQAVPSEAHQERFLRDFVGLAASADVPYFWFEMADEAWKVQATGSEAEGHWGLMDSARVLKPSIAAFFEDPPPLVEFTKTAGCGSTVLARRPCAGTVAGIPQEDRRRYRVVLYSFTDRWYVQPEAALPYTGIGRRGTWRVLPHKGTRYAALLVAEQYLPAPVLHSLPPVGGELLAISVASCDR